MPRKPHSFVDATHPVYRRTMPRPQSLRDFASDITHIDFTNAHNPPYPDGPVALSTFTAQFDARSAAAISDAVGFSRPVRALLADPPEAGQHVEEVLLESKEFVREDDVVAPRVLVPRGKCLAAVAFADYFPEVDAPGAAVGPDGLTAGTRLRRMVSDAILTANPGWCGTFGPGVDGLFDVVGDNPFGDDPFEGNYDMSQMHLLQIAYRHYDELSAEARELLIQVLLATGRIHRPNSDDIVTSGRVPDDWGRAGVVHVGPAKVRIGETENHILTIHTARYLTNQLLYQRDHDDDHDNRRNASEGAPTCTELMLALLRNMLRGDFSEYNAKPYQTETRSALLNLCSYAYDHEVRLAARMVLDYISAHIAISSCDLRRMVPFRRLNEDKHVRPLEDGSLGGSLLDPADGADPMAEPYAIQAGNLRAYETAPSASGKQAWAIGGDAGAAVAEALSDYRLPPSIHDLFVNDLSRRFFQRLHRIPQDDPVVTGRNCDNMEIYAGSPSYLISAGGAPAGYAIDPGPAIHFEKGRRKNAQQLGVAVTTSFMPTVRPTGDCGDASSAADLIQFGRFAADGNVANYGVAPDFACGPQVHLPAWCTDAIARDRTDGFGKFEFVNNGSAGNRPGFYLAFLRDGDFALMEAFDTWLHPTLTFHQFRINVFVQNKDLMERGLHSNVPEQYRTQNGSRVGFVIWKTGDEDGAKVDGVDLTDSRDALLDSFGDAAHELPFRFLNGTVMNSAGDGLVTITNHFLGTTLVLDMRDQSHPRRTSETGEIEEAGENHEVWVDFAWTGPNEGDFFRPFSTLAAASAAVVEGGIVKIMPGLTTERAPIEGNKRMRIVAPIGGVTIGMS